MPNYFIKGVKNLLWRLQKNKIKAVHESDFPDLLKSLGVDGKIASGETKCGACGETLTSDTIQALLPKAGQIIMICSKAVCAKNI